MEFLDRDILGGFSRTGSLLWAAANTAVGLLLWALGAFVDRPGVHRLWLLVPLLFVCAALLLRRTRPDLPRGFRVPGYPLVPVASVVACLYILSGLHWSTYAWFCAWLAVVLTFYVVWGRHHSKLSTIDLDASTAKEQA